MHGFHCGRQVGETTHWQKSYWVDVSDYTGTTEWD